MEPLTGLGLWIWQLAACEAGDLDAILERATRCGVSWIAVKGSHQVAKITPDTIDRFAEAGVTLATWWYSTPKSPGLTAVQSLLNDNGFRHFIIDPEIEWEIDGDHRVQAADLANRIRDMIGPDCFLADAPWPLRKGHPTYPFDEFGAVMNMRMPQVYWELHNTEGAAARKYFLQVDAEWEKEPFHRMCPIGSGVNFDGSKHSPVSDMGDFLDYFANATAISLWSWQHLSKAEWAMLEQRARHDTPAGCNLI